MVFHVPCTAGTGFKPAMVKIQQKSVGLKFGVGDKQDDALAVSWEPRREPDHQPWTCSSLLHRLWDELSSLLVNLIAVSQIT